MSANQTDVLTDMADLPSEQIGKGDNTKALAKANAARDVALSKELILRSWEAKKVRSILTCFHCGKRRCIYSPTDEVYSAALVALQQKLESVSARYSCGDLLFDDDHHLSKVLVQKKNLTCETPIEKGYYNHKERGLKLKDICSHCGEMGSSEFLLGTPELQKRSMTDGFKCFPICVDCLSIGKKPTHIGKKDAMQAKKEKTAKQAIARAASANKD